MPIPSIEHIQGYIGAHGLVHYKPPMASGNGLMYSSTTLLWLPMEQEAYADLGFELMANIKKCQGEPGQFFRTPDRAFGHQSYDDLFAVSGANIVHAANILQWLDSHAGFYWTTPNPNKIYTLTWWKFWGQIWLWRSPDFRIHLKMCLGTEIKWWERNLWIASVNTCDGTHDLDGWRKTQFKVRVARGCKQFQEDSEVQEACDAWSLRLKRYFPHGMGQVEGTYFGDMNHPNAQGLWDDFGGEVEWE